MSGGGQCRGSKFETNNEDGDVEYAEGVSDADGAERTFAAAVGRPGCLPIVNWRFFAVSPSPSLSPSPPPSAAIKPIDRPTERATTTTQRNSRGRSVAARGSVGRSQINRDLSLRGRPIGDRPVPPVRPRPSANPGVAVGWWGKTWPRITVVREQGRGGEGRGGIQL